MSNGGKKMNLGTHLPFLLKILGVLDLLIKFLLIILQ
jgi:hypothetical protein